MFEAIYSICGVYKCSINSYRTHCNSESYLEATHPILTRDQRNLHNYRRTLCIRFAQCYWFSNSNVTCNIYISVWAHLQNLSFYVFVPWLFDPHNVNLSIDRYIAFAHCFRYHNIVNQKNILHALLIIWSGSVTITGIAMVDTNILPNSSFVEVRESFSVMFPTIVFVASLILVAIHGRLYIVTKRLFDSEENRHRRLFGKDAELNDLRRRRLKTIALSFAITVSYLGTLIPISVILILLRQSDKYVAIGTIVGPLSGFNPVLDPIIYGLTNKNLRKDVIKQAKEFWSGIRNSKIWQRNNRVYAFP